MSGLYHDLSDDELRARLTQAGVVESTADRLIEKRDDPDVADAIERQLERSS